MIRFAAAALALAVCGLAAEPYRPRFHFSPAENWTNDPNGVVYFDGEYHLFFQYNPFGDVWGHMSWGHAVSTDLVHWRELPVALAEENGIMIFTGSTVVDERNTSGFCTGGKPCMIAVYTGHTPAAPGRRELQTQNIAYSNDRGRTWTKYRGNPVIDLHLPDFRDPHVFWSEAARHWVMVVALPGQHKVLFYRSADLKKWDRTGEFGPAGATGGAWECPTLAEVPVDGQPGVSRWVLKVGLNPGGVQGGSGEQYFVGSFDGTAFRNDNPPATTLWTDYGKDCYCALPYNHLPAGARPVMIGWMNNWQYADKTPTRPWRGQMTIPRRLALKAFPEGLRLVQQPVEGLARLRGERLPWQGNGVANVPDAFELRAEVEPGTAQAFSFRLRFGDAYTEVGYDAARGEVFVDRTHSGLTDFSPEFPGRTAAPLPLGGGPLRLVLVADRSSVEVFAQDGRVTLTNLVYPPEGARSVEFSTRGGRPGRVAVNAWALVD
ncbi:MAG TPA: glycoside hydrolase family 32 protein [Bryobacteraceae bacterium]|nr:glycoside hydrolase family 32 protein [Bryobacteraceae bacterium]